jgi:hypothetical protein
MAPLTGPGTHARTQGVVKETLVTEKNLPEHLKQSMFAKERGWPVLCRYSSEPGDPGLDVSMQYGTLRSRLLTRNRTAFPNPAVLP